MSEQWFEVQRDHKQVYVTRQSGGLPPLQSRQALIKIVAAGICGTDIRVMKGNKKISTHSPRYIIPGHEGVGRIVDIRESKMGLKQGDYVVILPHVHKDIPCSSSEINPQCIGNAHTLHRGWDIDGCFTDFIVVPETNLKQIDTKQLHLARKRAPDLGPAIFTFVEPMLCVMSAYKLIEDQSKILHRSEFKQGRALVIGCGPIGVLHGLMLLKRGYNVCFLDILQKRAQLARWCLTDSCSIVNEVCNEQDFDLVMVTASSADAVRKAEIMVRDGGIVYLFAGLNAIDYAAMDTSDVFYYERIHRATKGIITTHSLIQRTKTIFYLGHSGYFEHLTSNTITWVAEQADILNKIVTGIIPGWESPSIESRLPGGIDWKTTNGIPAIVSVLHGTDLRDRHCKLLILPR